MWAGLLGALVGALAGLPLLFGLGAFIGALVGAWIGCYLMERYKGRNDYRSPSGRQGALVADSSASWSNAVSVRHARPHLPRYFSGAGVS